MKGTRPAYTLETFVAKRVTITPAGCWEVSGADHRGYRKVRIKGVHLRAHRWTFEQAKGPIPAGLELDHLCRNRACCNPEHLEAVTHEENMRRARTAECVRGHARTPENTYYKPRPGQPEGQPNCRPCKRIRYAELKSERSQAGRPEHDVHPEPAGSLT